MVERARRGIHPPSLRPGDRERAFSYGFQAGEMLWVSGTVPIDHDGEVVGRGDVEAQITKVFENLTAIVREAGGTLDDVVKLSCYLTDPAHRDALQRIRGRFFRYPYPASILLYQPFIVSPDILVEVEAVAVIDATWR
jgi:2-iminobutanoate/2-iminopropanoate deaminase